MANHNNNSNNNNHNNNNKKGSTKGGFDRVGVKGWSILDAYMICVISAAISRVGDRPAQSRPRSGLSLCRSKPCCALGIADQTWP